jgi:hypothetical protein
VLVSGFIGPGSASASLEENRSSGPGGAVDRDDAGSYRFNRSLDDDMKEFRPFKIEQQ